MFLPTALDIELACLGLKEQSYNPYMADLHKVSSPSRPPEHVDSRLKFLDISHWSRVPVSSNWAAQAISLYLTTDHAVATLVDIDLFLRDLVEKRTEFCSPLLLSSLMFWASVSMLWYISRCIRVLTPYSKACLSSMIMLA